MDSDPWRSLLTFGGDASGYRRGENMTVNSYYDGLPYESGSKSKSLSEAFGAGWSGWFYPWSAPLGLTGSAGGNTAYNQNWGSSFRKEYGDSTRHEYRYETETWRYSYSVDAGVGVGYGRIRDVTTVFDIHVLEKRLQDEGVLSAPLSESTRKRLAELYFRRKTDFGFVHQRPDRFFWREVETILREDSALKSDALDGYSGYRIAEPIDGTRFSRQRGFFIGPVVSASHFNNIYNSTYKYHNVTYPDSGDVSDTLWSRYQHQVHQSDRVELGGSAEYHLPVGDRWQVDATANLSKPLNNLEESFIESTSLMAQYIIADRWQAIVRFQQNREIIESKSSDYRTRTDQWGVSLDGTLRYFVEDHLSLDLSVDHLQSKNRHYRRNNDYEDYYRNFNRQTYVSLGLTYLFAGAYMQSLGTPKSIPRDR
jgi:hypothetical protein